MKWLADLLHRKALKTAASRKPDFIVGESSRPYLKRWWLIPRNRFFNAYLHQFLRDDDDLALHDHPWFWCSVVIAGGYIEHTIADGGIQRKQHRRALSIKFGLPWKAHRIELFPLWWMAADSIDGACQMREQYPDQKAPCWTLFFTGPRIRAWGFHCSQRGWVPWEEFTAPGAPGEVGPGCDGGNQAGDQMRQGGAR